MTCCDTSYVLCAVQAVLRRCTSTPSTTSNPCLLTVQDHNKHSIKESIPGTDEHAMTHPDRGTGFEGIKNAIKVSTCRARWCCCLHDPCYAPDTAACLSCFTMMPWQLAVARC